MSVKQNLQQDFQKEEGDLRHTAREVSKSSPFILSSFRSSLSSLFAGPLSCCHCLSHTLCVLVKIVCARNSEVEAINRAPDLGSYKNGLHYGKQYFLWDPTCATMLSVSTQARTGTDNDITARSVWGYLPRVFAYFNCYWKHLSKNHPIDG